MEACWCSCSKVSCGAEEAAVTEVTTRKPVTVNITHHSNPPSAAAMDKEIATPKKIKLAETKPLGSIERFKNLKN